MMNTKPAPKPDPTTGRDLVGYGEFPPNPAWPGNALIAVNINLNFEGGGERSVPEGDAASEGALNDIGQPALPPRRRQPARRVGVRIRLPRVGGWRLLRAVSAIWGQGVPAGGRQGGLERNPELTRAFVGGRARDRQPRLSLARLPDIRRTSSASTSASASTDRASRGCGRSAG